MIIKKTLFFIGFNFIVLGCSSSDENTNDNLAKPEINDLSITNSDVNADEYWSNTKLVWSDEFEENTLSNEKWLIETAKAGQGFGGWQDFTSDGTLEVSDGSLKIHTRLTGVGQNLGDYSSARLNSAFAFTYGKLEVRAKLPNANGSGLWSKVFLLGNNIRLVGYPLCGQVSFLEYVSHVPNQIFNTVHTAENVLNGEKLGSSSGFISLETAEEEFHLYGVLWTDQYLKFYIDDIENVIFEFNRPSEVVESNWPFSNSFYFVIDTSVGEEFSDGNGVNDSIFPATLEIDYIRVYHSQ